MIKKTVISIALILFFNGCNNSQENHAGHDTNATPKVKTELSSELKKDNVDSILVKKKEQKHNDNPLAHLGITKNGDTIVIDTNKTKTFLKIMADTMKEHIDKFEKDIQDGIIENKEAGIEMNKTHINIDLNKTKSFLEIWEKTITEYAKEFDKMSK